MSRPFWHVEVKVQLVNGQAGSVHLEARDLVTFREVRDVFDRAVRMCETLKSEPVADAPQYRAPNLKAVS